MNTKEKDCAKAVPALNAHHRIFTLINLTGLATGMAGCIMIMLYVTDELSYDRYHENAEQIYREDWLQNFAYRINLSLQMFIWQGSAPSCWPLSQ